MKTILITLLVLLSSPAQGYEVECNGWNSETEVWVYGTCDSGDFSGWDSETGVWVWRECEIGGELSAWNSETDVWVWGECDS